MRYYFLIIVLILFSCNSNQQNTKQKEIEIKKDECSLYPSVVDSLQIKDLYDSAKWYVYTFQCDEKYFPQGDSTKSTTLGELPLGFRYAGIKHDTLEIIFNFMEHNQIILPSMIAGKLSTGVGFDLKTKSKIYMMFAGGKVSYKENSSRYINPLQPEVMDYIKINWDKLNNCFRGLAEQKGLK